MGSLETESNRPMPTIIFVDIDGVILPLGGMSGVELRDMIREPYDYIEDATKRVPAHTVANLLNLANHVDAQFVLISSWRGLFSREFLQSFLQNIGMFFAFHKDWEAPMRGFPPRPWKARDIGEWLGDHPGCTAVVIDDEDLKLHDGGVGDAIVIRPIGAVGFSRDDLARCLRALDVKPEACA